MYRLCNIWLPLLLQYLPATSDAESKYWSGSGPLISAYKLQFSHIYLTFWADKWHCCPNFFYLPLFRRFWRQCHTKTAGAGAQSGFRRHPKFDSVSATLLITKNAFEQTPFLTFCYLKCKLCGLSYKCFPVWNTPYAKQLVIFNLFLLCKKYVISACKLSNKLCRPNEFFFRLRIVL